MVTDVLEQEARRVAVPSRSYRKKALCTLPAQSEFWMFRAEAQRVPQNKRRERQRQRGRRRTVYMLYMELAVARVRLRGGSVVWQAEHPADGQLRIERSEAFDAHALYVSTTMLNLGHWMNPARSRKV